MATKVPPRQLSRELRETHNDPDLNRRRWIVGLSFASLAAGKLVSLFQFGMIKELPDPPIDIFDSTKVDASDYAYKRFQSPDAFVMVVSSGITAWLAAAGGVNRAEQNPALPLLMAAKTWGDLLTTVQLGREEWDENKKLCFYCQAATVLSVASAVLSVPEALRAIEAIKNGDGLEMAQTSAMASDTPASFPSVTTPDDADLPRSGTFIAEDRWEATPGTTDATESLTLNGSIPTTDAPSEYQGMPTVDGAGHTDAVDEDVNRDSDEMAAADLNLSSRSLFAAG